MKKQRKKVYVENLGTEVKNLWNLKRKQIEKKNLRRRKNLRVNGVHLEFGRARKGMENLEEFKRNLGRLMKELK